LVAPRLSFSTSRLAVSHNPDILFCHRAFLVEWMDARVSIGDGGVIWAQSGGHGRHLSDALLFFFPSTVMVCLNFLHSQILLPE
jgi:hypothetical protein